MENLLPREQDLLGRHDLTRQRLDFSLSRFTHIVGLLDLGNPSATPSSPDFNLNVADLRDELGRLRVWIGNIGGLRRGHGSLEYRLQDSPLVYANVHKIIIDLNEDLQEIHDVVSGRRLPYEEQDEFGSEESEDDSSVTSTKRSSSPSSSLDEELLPELQERFSSIVKEIDALYEIAVYIRNPNTRSRIKKALAFKPPIDPETNFYGDILEQYLKFDLRHTREFFKDQRTLKVVDPRTRMVSVEKEGIVDEQDENLIMRLAQAITQRRQRFKYWKSHRDKLARGASLEYRASLATNTDGFITQEATDAVVFPNQAPSGASVGEMGVRDLAEGGQSISHKPSAVHTGTDTTATRFLASMEEAERDYPESIRSFLTSTRGNDTVDFPPPPKHPAHGPFECPYCYTICPESYRQHKEWKNHLLLDLQPYVCTYEACLSGGLLFSSRGEWIEHELWSHRRVWRCSFDLCSDEVEFMSKENFKSHLSQAHTDLFSSQEHLETLCKTGEGLARNPRGRCPICREYNTNQEELQKHIGHHLERLSTFSLPRSASDSDSDDSQEGIGPGSGNSLRYGAGSVNDGSSGKISWGSSKRPSETHDPLLSDSSNAQALDTMAPTTGDLETTMDLDPQSSRSERLESGIEGHSKEESKELDPDSSLEQPSPPVDLWDRLEEEDLRSARKNKGWAVAYRSQESPRVLDIQYYSNNSYAAERFYCVEYCNSGNIVAVGRIGSIRLIWVDTKDNEATTIEFTQEHSASRSTYPVVEKNGLNNSGKFGTEYSYYCRSLCFSNDDKYLIIAWSLIVLDAGDSGLFEENLIRGYIWIYSLTEDKIIHEVSLEQSIVYDLAFCAHSPAPGEWFTFLSGFKNLEMVLWRYAYDEREDTHRVAVAEVVTGPTAEGEDIKGAFFKSVSVSSDRRYIIALGSHNVCVYMWQSDLKAFVGRFLPAGSNKYGDISKIRFLPTEQAPAGKTTSSNLVDYTILSAGSGNGASVQAWRLPREPSRADFESDGLGAIGREPVFTLRGHKLGAYSAFSVFPNSQYLLTSSGDYTIAIWNLSTKEAETVIKLNYRYYVEVSCAVSPKGNSFATIDTVHGLRIWNLDFP